MFSSNRMYVMCLPPGKISNASTILQHAHKQQRPKASLHRAAARAVALQHVALQHQCLVDAGGHARCIHRYCRRNSSSWIITAVEPRVWNLSYLSALPKLPRAAQIACSRISRALSHMFANAITVGGAAATAAAARAATAFARVPLRRARRVRPTKMCLVRQKKLKKFTTVVTTL